MADWRMLIKSGLEIPVADAEYFAKTLPGIAEQDITGADRERLLDRHSCGRQGGVRCVSRLPRLRGRRRSSRIRRRRTLPP